MNLERLDRSVVSVTTFAEAEQEDRQFWYNRTPEERLIYVEWLRQRNWGYDPATTRLQRVLAIIERSSS